jgi:putative ABC transport system ATP-binding protein
VQVDGVSKTFREGAAVTHVLRTVTLELTRSETTSLVGSSGSGKSTLLGLIGGLLLPDSGRVVFDGHDLADLDDTARARLRATRVGIVLQTGNLIPFLTAVENVELALQLGGHRRARARARALLAELGLTGRLDHLPRRLSGGEAQRVAVAMALAPEPELLLADEVTGELDSANAAEVMAVITTASRERALTVLFVTHSPEIARGAQHRLRLADGAVVPA